MGKDYQNYYDEMRDYLESLKKELPRGISIVIKNNSTVQLRFKTKGKKRATAYSCNEKYTKHGLHNALSKAMLLKEQLESYESEVSFWSWYDENIKGINKNAVNDVVSVADAVKNVETWFYSQKDRRGLKRTKKADSGSFKDTYGRFYKILVENNKSVNFDLLKTTLFNYCSDKKERRFQDCLSAYLKLCEVNELNHVYSRLAKLRCKRTQTSKDYEHQFLSLDELLQLKKGILEDENHRYYERRKYWMWIYSLQMLYGLRIGEIPAIKNLFNDYIPSKDVQEGSNDNTVFKALNDPNNTDNIIYVGNYTVWNTKVKTGNRIAMPLIPAGYSDLLDELDIKCTHEINTASKITFNGQAKGNLQRWSQKYLGRKVSQTHTIRKLGNANGISAGIPDSVRCKSLGHSEAINRKHYQNWSGQTTIDLFNNAKRQPIDLKSAIKLAKSLGSNVSKNQVLQLIADIYQVDYDELIKLL